jgi:hypothetical protein
MLPGACGFSTAAVALDNNTSQHSNSALRRTDIRASGRWFNVFMGVTRVASEPAAPFSCVDFTRGGFDDTEIPAKWNVSLLPGRRPGNGAKRKDRADIASGPELH